MCQLEQGQVKPTQKHESLGIHTPNTKNNAFLGNIFGCKKKTGRRTPPDNHWTILPNGCPGPSSGMVSTLNGSTNLRLSSVEFFHHFADVKYQISTKCNESDSLCFQRVLKDWDVPRVCGSSSFHVLTLSRLPQSEMSNVRLESIAPEGPSDDLTIFASSSNPIG